MNTKRIFTAIVFLILGITVLFAYNNLNTNVFIPQHKVEANESESYKSLWEKAEKYNENGLPKSALQVVKVIYKKAKTEHNEPQFLKAILNITALESSYKENYFPESIDFLQREISQAQGAEKAVLQSILAERYFQYYMLNSWKINSRSQTLNFKKNDMETWAPSDFYKEIVSLYQKSLSQSNLLKQVPLQNYDIILITEKNSKNYRPTLYDFLAYRAFNFYKNRTIVLLPEVTFDFNDKEYFSPADEFIKLKFSTPDTLSIYYLGIGTIQKIIAFHRNDPNPDALIDADLQRLEYVKERYSLSGGDSLYMQALKNLYRKFKGQAAVSRVIFKIAELYQQRAANYKADLSENYRWDLKTAMSYLDEAIENYPENDGVYNCKVLKERILQKKLSLTSDEANPGGTPFLAKVNFKNISKFYIQTVKFDQRDFSRLKNKKASVIIKKLLKSKSVFSSSFTPGDDGDFRMHSSEIKIPALPLGYYVIIVSDNPEFDVTKTVAFAGLRISNLSYIFAKRTDDSYDFYVADRSSGKRIAGVKVVVFRVKYNYRKRAEERTKVLTSETDENGYFKLENLQKDRYSDRYAIEFSKDKDLLIGKDIYQYRPWKATAKPKIITKFFTDRKIYRPGQSIFFKALVYKKTGENYELQKNYKSKVVLRDVNRQVVDTLVLITNDYGSFHGKFRAPSAGITGHISISNENGSIALNVEEYKRPNFSVKMEKPGGSYKLNEKVKLKGKVLAYAGFGIDGATVNYRIERAARFPFWYYRYGSMPSSPARQIVHGTTTTNENGEFEIDFKAIPDLTLPSKTNPVFNYDVYAEVTDLNGETHTAQSSVIAGYKALLLNIDIGDRVNIDEKTSFTLSTTNLAGAFTPAKGEIKIYPLKTPTRLMRGRKWDKPDKHLISKKDFLKDFPNDVYDDEDEIYSWERENHGAIYSFYTRKNTRINLSESLKGKAKAYEIEMTAKDTFGNDVVFSKRFSVFSPEAKRIPVMSYAWFEPLTKSAEPGENAEFLLGTSAKNVNVLFEIETKEGVAERKFIKLNREQRKISIPVKENYRGNFSYSLTFIKNNRVYIFKQKVKVPYTNKKLDIEFSTFRNKIYPGQKEEWNIKIKGAGGEKVAAELLAGMYDASLDAFAPNHWYFNIYRYFNGGIAWKSGSFGTSSGLDRHYYPFAGYRNQKYDRLNNFNLFTGGYYGNYPVLRGAEKALSLEAVTIEKDGQKPKKKSESAEPLPVVDSDMEEAAAPPAKPKSANDKVRKNFNETAFFYPDLHTDEQGNIVLKFTAPESLTRWKIMAFAHSKDLSYGMTTKELVTQKELMVIPAAPRFFREKDTLVFSAKISNMTDKNQTGTARLQLFDALTMEPVDGRMDNLSQEKEFSAAAGHSAKVSWKIIIPQGLGAVTYRVSATAGNFTDGEEKTAPVLSNRMLVTETLPLPVRGKGTKTFTFKKLTNSGTSSSLTNHRLTLEFTPNPAWYAVQALPYLMEYPHECSEQIFSRYYANSLAFHIVNSKPEIKKVFDQWSKYSPEAFLSNLEKNQELKNLILNETPWLLEAKNETRRKREIANYFHLDKMAAGLEKALSQLRQAQLPSGGWPWFKGGNPSRYITQHIVTGSGHLKALGINDFKTDKRLVRMLRKAVYFLDNQIERDYEYLKKHYAESMNKKHIGNIQIQYLYARSFFADDFKIQNKNEEAFNYYLNQAEKYWKSGNNYMQGMTALALKRFNKSETAKKIIASLKERSLHSEEQGMYWRNERGWFWYQAPVETQALMIEAFDEITKDSAAVEDMKVWLLKQKQTQDWKTTKATAEACYALLMHGKDLLASDESVTITLGDKKISTAGQSVVKSQAGTVYFKTAWDGKEVSPQMGNITVTKKDDGVAWGAVYWQYFEDLDKISSAKTPLKLEKQLFVERNTASGTVIEPVSDTNTLKVGDKVKVRIVLRVDRTMEFVHMKDMRASAFEPADVISGYRWQGGLGYYQSTRDAATDFFFDRLTKGTYVFEYEMFVTHSGSFSNGITTIQSMYAPEFSAHSEGVRVMVE